MRKTIIYNPNLSVVENARNNNVSIGTIRKYILDNNIDRRYDKKMIIITKIQRLKRANPSVSLSEIRRKLGYSINTIKKYLNISEDGLSVKYGKHSRFDISKSSNLIKSVSDNQDEILKNIISLYVRKGYIDCDLTFSKGMFYKTIPLPLLKYDKYPYSNEVSPLEEAYELKDSSLHSIVVDLPFIVRTPNEAISLINQRFNSFSTIEELYSTNISMLELAYKKLKNRGLLIMKTMDINFNGTQYWIGNFVQNEAFRIGFELVDTFILISRTKILSANGNIQHCARKWHSYFFVFKKGIKG